MKASSLITCVTEKASRFIRIARGKTASGSKTNKTELALRTGWTAPTSGATTWMARKRALDCSNGQMAQSTKETGIVTRLPALEFGTGQTKESTRASSSTANRKASATISILKATSTLASTSETRGKGLECTKRPEAAPTQDHG